MSYKWLLDAGHGGIVNGRYVTAPSKMHRFDDGFEVYEGVINRQITAKLVKLLHEAGIDFGLVYDEHKDTSLDERVAIANRVHKKYPNSIYLSIHSNAGDGKGIEIFTFDKSDESDPIAKIFWDVYNSNFKSMFVMRGNKKANFHVLRETNCRAVLVENLFFDNRVEAEFLVSEVGQMAIAQCMFEAIQLCETTKPI